MRILWLETDDLQAVSGHGVNFFALRGSERGELIAALRGFEWLHRRPDTVEIAICKPSGDIDERFLEDARAAIESYVTEPRDLSSYVSPTVWAGING